MRFFFPPEVQPRTELQIVRIYNVWFKAGVVTFMRVHQGRVKNSGARVLRFIPVSLLPTWATQEFCQNNCRVH